MITFKAFENQLALRGFHNKESLDKIWLHVHEHSAGCMDFSEFLVVMFLWGEVGDYNIVLETPSTSDIVKAAFSALHTNWMVYCKDRSLKIHHNELYKLMTDKMPHLLEHSRQMIDKYFPLLQSASSDELSFPKFMHLLYCCFVELSKSSRPTNKKYLDSGVMKHLITKRKCDISLDSSIHGSVAWEYLRKAFTILEKDFESFNKNADGNIEIQAITAGVPAMAGVRLFDVLSRLEGFHDKAMTDWADGIDFNDFLFLVFLMTRDGSYSLVVGNSQDHRQVDFQFFLLFYANFGS